MNTRQVPGHPAAQAPSAWWRHSMMWLVVGNMGVLPFDVLPYAVPWSLLECFGAAWIIGKVDSKP